MLSTVYLLAHLSRFEYRPIIYILRCIVSNILQCISSDLFSININHQQIREYSARNTNPSHWGWKLMRALYLGCFNTSRSSFPMHTWKRHKILLGVIKVWFYHCCSHKILCVEKWTRRLESSLDYFADKKLISLFLFYQRVTTW